MAVRVIILMKDKDGVFQRRHINKENLFKYQTIENRGKDDK